MAEGWGLFSWQLLLKSLATGSACLLLSCLPLLSPKEPFCCTIWWGYSWTNQLCSAFALQMQRGVACDERKGEQSLSSGSRASMYRGGEMPEEQQSLVLPGQHPAASTGALHPATSTTAQQIPPIYTLLASPFVPSSATARMSCLKRVI